MKFFLFSLQAQILVLSVLVAIGLVISTQGKSSARTQTCAAFVQLNAAISRENRQGEHEAASLTYYKQHPAELARVIRTSEQQLAELEKNDIPSYC